MSRRFWNFASISNEEVELRIDGDIVDDGWAWIYEWFNEPATSPNAFRKELKAHEGKDLTIWIDSYGGDVVAAAGIYHAILAHKGEKTVIIDGKAMSAASVIAMAGDKVYVNPMSVMMIHNPWVSAQGDSEELRHTAGILDTIKESIINAYQKKTKRARKDIDGMMSEETWMDAKMAIKEGFADGMYEPKENTGSKMSDNVKNGFEIARLSFQNSADERIKQMLEIYTKQQKSTPTPPDNDGVAAVNLYQAQILLNRRINNV
jgi:ATP-dependent Clp protease protease subunit